MGSNYYYHITALDTTPLYTNESWYSAQATASLIVNPGPFYVATNGNDTHLGTLSAPFRTIQHAANIMGSGPLAGVTSATTYIEPGIYNARVIIASNKNLGYMVFTASNTANQPVLFGASTTNFGFKITNTSQVMISAINISKYVNGIYICGNSTNNFIINNTLFSNVTTGLTLTGHGTKFNMVTNNNIHGTGGAANGNLYSFYTQQKYNFG